jgi:dTDP-glucose 4,6-dehydratase
MLKENARFLVTGGAGFIGSHFCDNLLEKYPNANITVMDNLTYAGVYSNIPAKCSWIRADISTISYLYGYDYIINFAAESHVDNSINNGTVFANTNVVGVANLLQLMKKVCPEARFLQVSTDEVYGHILDDTLFTETTPLAPRSPYSASKAGGDMIALSYHQTHNLDVVVTRCCNNYGTRQHKEKFIPTIITKALMNSPIPVYGDGQNIREWIHVKDHCDAILDVLEFGKSGEVYNIGSGLDLTNLHLVNRILKRMNKPESLITFVEDRKGHDRCYRVNCNKLHTLTNWFAKHHILEFDEEIDKLVKWYAK